MHALLERNEELPCILYLLYFEAAGFGHAREQCVLKVLNDFRGAAYASGFGEWPLGMYFVGCKTPLC